eukprot:3337752-Amphidinium_carterae.1
MIASHDAQSASPLSTASITSPAVLHTTRASCPPAVSFALTHHWGRASDHAQPATDPAMPEKQLQVNAPKDFSKCVKYRQPKELSKQRAPI